MSLPSKKVPADFPFKHSGNPDKYGQSLGGNFAQVQTNFDARAIYNQTQINKTLDALASTIDGDSGLDNIGMTPIVGLTATTPQQALEEINAKSPINIADGSVTDLKLSNTAGQIKDVVSKHTRQLNDISINVKEFGAIGDGITDDSVSIQSAMTFIQNAGGGTVIFEPGKTYKLKDVVLPNCSGWTIDGNWSKALPVTAAATCFKANYTTKIFNTIIKNFNLIGNVTDFIRFNLTSVGVLLNCLVDGITVKNSVGVSIVTVNSTASGQGETVKVKNITLLGEMGSPADYDYVARFIGASSGYGSCEFSTIFHNGDVGIATIYAESGLFLATFDTLYHTRGSCVKIGPGFSAVSCKFKAMETEAVEHGTKIYDGSFLNCNFDISAVYNQLLTGPFTEQIGDGVFKQCRFENNFVFQRTNEVITFDATSTRNTMTDLQIGSATFVAYDAILDNGTYNTFVGKQYTSPVAVCTGAITATSYFEIIKNGRVVTLFVPKVQGIASATTFFSLGTSIATAGVDFLPTLQLQYPVIIVDNNAQKATPGALVILTTGEIRVYASSDVTTTYTAGQTSGIADTFAVTWVV